MSHAPPLSSTLVSIGVPTYNAADTIEATLDAILAQDHLNIEVVVADNASADDTVRVCEVIASEDPRLRIVRHDENMGWQYNFRYVLSAARGPYFMWVGADDRPAPTFVSRNLELLEQTPELVASISRVRWLQSGEPGELAAGTDSLRGSTRSNTAEYLRRARDNSRFYALHRTDVLRSSFPNADFYMLDLAVMLGTLRQGGHGLVDEVLLERERSDVEGYVQYIQRDARSKRDLILPMRGFNRAILRDLRVPLSGRALWWLLVRNVYEHLRYWLSTGGSYGRLVRPLFQGLDAKRRRSRDTDDLTT